MFPGFKALSLHFDPFSVHNSLIFCYIFFFHIFSSVFCVLFSIILIHYPDPLSIIHLSKYPANHLVPWETSVGGLMFLIVLAIILYYFFNIIYFIFFWT